MKKPSEEECAIIKRSILRKLYMNGAFSKGHLLYERLQTSVASHLRGYIHEMLKELVKEKMVIAYGRTKHGDAYQLNIKKLKEIEEIVNSPKGLLIETFK